MSRNLLPIAPAKAPSTLDSHSATSVLRIVILGLSITSSWGNGHATTYRSLVRALAERGHHVLFLERDVPWYASNRDLPDPPYGVTKLYKDLSELKRRFTGSVRGADLVVLGSYVPQGVAVGEWLLNTARGITAFYDIDTPITLARLARGDTEYLAPHLIPQFRFYLSFSGGASLEKLEQKYGAQAAYPFHCSVDPHLYFPEPVTEADAARWDLGYMGTYSEDRQPGLEELLLQPARANDAMRFVVAGPMYPATIAWPDNVERIEHLPPQRHRSFYNRQRCTLNITRSDMVAAGYSPSVRLFEAAACGTPIISDYWPGLETFFKIDEEILVASSAAEVLDYLKNMTDAQLDHISERARCSVLAHHSAQTRARQLESYVVAGQ